jgi:hypothetical protein
MKSLENIRDIIIVQRSEINEDSVLCAFCQDIETGMGLLQHRTQMH